MLVVLAIMLIVSYCLGLSFNSYAEPHRRRGRWVLLICFTKEGQWVLRIPFALCRYLLGRCLDAAAGSRGGGAARSSPGPASWKHRWSKHGFSRIPSKHPQIANSKHICNNHVWICWYSAKNHVYSNHVFTWPGVAVFVNLRITSQYKAEWWYGMIRCDDTMRYERIWYGMLWHNVIRHAMIYSSWTWTWLEHRQQRCESMLPNTYHYTCNNTNN